MDMTEDDIKIAQFTAKVIEMLDKPVGFFPIVEIIDLSRASQDFARKVVQEGIPWNA